jgi:hypothetical protein
MGKLGDVLSHPNEILPLVSTQRIQGILHMMALCHWVYDLI